MSEIYQNFAGVADLHAQLVSGQKAIEATLDRIEGQVAPLIATWDSGAGALRRHAGALERGRGRPHPGAARHRSGGLDR